ncbi:MAG: hypothetical protein KDA44_18770 [Planctomycetales bacterium]|nr:hypothetical protein [Planctomycetales bacterium]
MNQSRKSGLPCSQSASARALARIAAELSRGLDDRSELPAAAALDLIAWGRQMLPHYFRQPPSKMHRWLGEQLDRGRGARGLKLNVLGPRGAAKSTIGTLCYPLRCAVEASEPYIWIVSDTLAQAQTHLENLKTELESNRHLAENYPRACGRGPRWRAAAIELGNGVVIESYGTGQSLRGRRRREHRPTLIVCDDLQNDSHIASATQRESSRQWFHGALLKAGSRGTNVLNLATALHRDALAMQLDRTAGWTSAVFRAIERWPTARELWDEWERLYVDRDRPDAATIARAFFDEHRAAMQAGAELLWPEVEDLYLLMRLRAEEGHTAFEREKQNSPIDPARCEWPEDYFSEEIWFRNWPAELRLRVMALDPSKGADARHGDYSAFVLLGVDTTGALYVEADLARRPTPQMVADGVALCRRFQPDAFGVEANQYQELLAGEFVAEFRRQKQRIRSPALIRNHTNKQMRIRRLGPLLSQGRLRFLASSPSTQLLVDQLRDFPLGTHDDGPDSLEMALQLVEAHFERAGVDDGLGSRLI